jgi:peptide/nickel transport system permease protein
VRNVIAYALRRFAQAILTIFLVTLLVFFLYQLIPLHGSESIPSITDSPAQAAALAAQPPIAQYFHMIGMWLTGNLGYFAPYNEPLSLLLGGAMQESAVLVVGALIVSFAIGIPLGLAQGYRQGRTFDRVTTVIAFVLMATPLFFAGQLLSNWFTYRLPIFPADDTNSGQLGSILLDFGAMILPIVTLALPNIARLSRISRSAVLDQMYSDYVRTARSKGCSTTRIIWRHVFRNSLIPILTFIGLSLPLLFSGALVVESLFNIQGLGYYLWQAAQPTHLYYQVEIGVLLLSATVIVFANLLVDLTLLFVDPRIAR